MGDRSDLNFWGFTIVIVLATLSVILVQISWDVHAIRQSLERPAITEADRHSIKAKE